LESAQANELRLNAQMIAQKRRSQWGLTELVVALRWAALSLSLLAMVVISGSPTKREVAAGGVLALYAIVRTVWPLRFSFSTSKRQVPAERPSLLDVVVEVGLCVMVVLFTGSATSPFLLSLGAAVFIAGLRVAPAVLAFATVGSIVGLGAAGLAGLLGRQLASAGIERAALLGALAMLASYSDWLLRLGMRENTGELERLRALAEVNHLLLELHARAASLPASLNLKAAIANTISRLRDLLQPDVVVLFLADPTAERSHWEVVVADGLELPASVRQGELPDAMKEASRSLGPLLRAELTEADGVTLGAISGVYVPLWARDTLVGLLAVERVDNREPFTEADADIVAGVARHAGLAIDNARWFRRLRTLGAEEERGRIAREMHDRLGQSLAYVAISLDRMATESRNGTSSSGWQETADELQDLATEVRKATRDVRSKLTDLRVDLTEEVDLTEALAGLLERVEQRSGIVTSLRTDGEGALSPVTEREVVRIAQEAINNAERHSGAHHIDVRWRCNTASAELEVVDDGKGLAASAPLRRDAFGILGMRERADAIGARFGITSPPGQGTMVRLQLGQPVTNGRR
jgi:signal transduction histidine kinase